MQLSRRDLTDVVGPDDEVVEEVFAKGEIVELVVVEQQDDGPDAAFALAQLATEIHGLGEGERRGVDDRAGEAVGRFERRNLVKSGGRGDGGRHAGEVKGFAEWPLAP